MEQQVKSIPTEEIEEFKKLVHKWLEFDDNIKKLKDAEKKLNESKKELTEPIMEFMSKNNIEDCNTTNGKLKYSITQVKKPINRQYLTDKLANYFNNSKKSDEVTSFLFDNREVEQKVNLRRTFMKGNNLSIK
jgi:hypothetical protein